MTCGHKSVPITWSTCFLIFSILLQRSESATAQTVTKDPPPTAAALDDAGVPEAALEQDAYAEPAEPGDAESATELDQITVTARHRVENLQEVPIAVTAVTARDLEASGNFTLRQVQNQVPSLQILGFNPRNITIQIRDSARLRARSTAASSQVSAST
jgi:outer membrane receptor protein involved in Fe transport